MTPLEQKKVPKSKKIQEEERESEVSFRRTLCLLCLHRLLHTRALSFRQKIENSCRERLAKELKS
jgi:hypothetical protein